MRELISGYEIRWPECQTAFHVGEDYYISGIFPSINHKGKLMTAIHENQAFQVFNNMRDVLASAGLSVDDVVEIIASEVFPNEINSLGTTFAFHFRDTPIKPIFRIMSVPDLPFWAKIKLDIHAIKR